jgi:hypothetical protein
MKRMFRAPALAGRRAVAVCYVWLDHPIALFVHERFARFDPFARLGHVPVFRRDQGPFRSPHMTGCPLLPRGHGARK